MKRIQETRPLKQRTVKLRHDQDDAFAELAWQERKSYSELLREVLDWYLHKQHRETGGKNSA